MTYAAVITLGLCCILFLPAAACVAAPPPFRIGIEFPTKVPISKAVENSLRQMGISYINYCIYTDAVGASEKPAEVNSAVMEMADRLNLDYSIASQVIDPPDDCVREAVVHGKASGRFRGVVFDELEHCRLLWPYNPLPLGHISKFEPLADASKFQTLDQAYKSTLDGFTRLRSKFEKLESDTTSTHVWPVMHHIAARTGFVVCPKICKEFYSSVSLAMGMGAAKQYGRDLWVDCDMWYWDLIPGHSPEEMKSNLLLAYWLGADLVYLEGAGYNMKPAGSQGTPFSLVSVGDEGSFQLTAHGEALRWFCRDYLPAHPRTWTFRDVKPDIAIVRFEDTCYGQRYIGGDSLYGTNKLNSDRDTEAWFGLWNLLTFGKTGRDGLSLFKVTAAGYSDQIGLRDGVYIMGSEAESYLSRPAQADQHRFFVPLNGVVVYDHLATYDLLKDVPLIFLTGKEVSDATMAAVHKCVNDGAVCVAWGPLAKKHGFAEWESGVVVKHEGKGRFVLTDDFGVTGVYCEVSKLIGRNDEIRYRFGDHAVTLRHVTDNEVTVETR